MDVPYVLLELQPDGRVIIKSNIEGSEGGHTAIEITIGVLEQSLAVLKDTKSLATKKDVTSH